MYALLQNIKDRHKDVVFSWRPSQNDEWRPFTYSGVDTALGRALEKAEIKDFHFHDLRHTAGTRLLRKSNNLRVVQRMLRHERIETTLRYAHVLDQDVRDALEAMADDEEAGDSREDGK